MSMVTPNKLYHSLIGIQLCVKPDSSPLPDISAKSAKCHSSFRSLGSSLFINVHYSRESTSQKGEFIDNLQS